MERTADYLRGFADAISAAINACEAAEAEWWRDYKRPGEHQADRHREGMSDGATQLIDRIKAIRPTQEGE